MPTEPPHQETLRQRLHDLKTTDVDLSWVSVRQNGEELRERYRVLEQPCYGLVTVLREASLLQLLAEHAQLESVPSLRPFPYRVPRPRRTQDSVEIWSPGDEQGTDDATANARMLLWFAVAYSPDEFSADLLFWQQLLRSLPLYRPTGEGGRKVRPLGRIQQGVCRAARALIEAAHDGAGDHRTEVAEGSGTHSSGDDLQASFSKLISIARYLGIDASTLWRWRHNGVLPVERRDGKCLCSKSKLEMLRESRPQKS